MSARIAFKCRHCGERNVFDVDRAGKPTLCAHCGMKIDVPSLPSGSGSAAGSPVRIKIGCGLCGHRQYVDGSLAGRGVTCDGCGKKIRVPGPSTAAPRPAAAAPASERSETAPREQPRRRQPQQLAAVESDGGPADNDVYGLEEAPVVLSPRGSFAPPQAAAAPEPCDVPKKKKRKKKQGVGLSTGEVLGTIGAIAGTIAVVAVLAAALPDSRMPLGIVLGIAGFITTLVGNFGIRQAALEAGGLHYLMCRFVPFYSILFILTHWADTRSHLVVYCVGMSLLLPGAFLFGMAELHEKAAARANAHGQAPGNLPIDDEGDPN